MLCTGVFRKRNKNPTVDLNTRDGNEAYTVSSPGQLKCLCAWLCAHYIYYPYTTADSASTDVEEDKGNVTQFAKNWLDLQVVLQTRPSGIRQVLPAAERNVDVDVVVVVRPQEVHILSAICMDLLIMVMNRSGVSLFSSCDKPTGPKH